MAQRQIEFLIPTMDPKQQTGGRELNKISAAAGQYSKPIFFRLAKFETQEVPGGLTEVKDSSWQNRSIKLFDQTFDLSNL